METLYSEPVSLPASSPASSEAVILKPPSEPVREASPPSLISIGDTAKLQEQSTEQDHKVGGLPKAIINDAKGLCHF